VNRELVNRQLDTLIKTNGSQISGGNSLNGRLALLPTSSSSLTNTSRTPLQTRTKTSLDRRGGKSLKGTNTVALRQMTKLQIGERAKQ
jgi:hypothetical protein